LVVFREMELSELESFHHFFRALWTSNDRERYVT
jgi:hypothetical protein